MKVTIIVFILGIYSCSFALSPHNDPWYTIHTYEDAIQAMKDHNSRNELYDGLYVLRILVLKNKFKSIRMQYALATQYLRIVKAHPQDKHARVNLKHNLQAIKKALKSGNLNQEQSKFYSEFYNRLSPIYNQ